MAMWRIDVNVVLTMSEHNKRAHYIARIMRNRFETYRKAFAYYMSMSMMLNYCKESLGGC